VSATAPAAPRRGRAVPAPRSLRYLLYGLSAEADAPLPGLAPGPAAAAAPDLRIHVGRHPPHAVVDGPAWYVAEREDGGGEPTLVIHRLRDGGWRLRYADGTVFTVDAAAATVGCTWAAPWTVHDMATYLLGPVLGFVLRMRGVTCLHASAVAVGDGAVLVCGAAGAGKSTTAAALRARGHRVLADDVAALDVGGGGVTVRPAYPHLRLWPDAVRALYGAVDLPPLTPTWDKRWLDLAAGGEPFPSAPLPVHAVYVLAGREDGDAPRVEPVPAAEGVLHLVTHTYMGWLPYRAAEARDLAVYARLARAAPVRLAVPHADPARLPELCDRLAAPAGDAA